MPLSAELVGALGLLLGGAALAYPAVRADRHSRFVARWVGVLSQVSGAPPGRTARLLLPFLLWLLWILAGCAGVLAVESGSGAQGGAGSGRMIGVLVWLVVFVLLGLLVLLVARTGRPRLLVIAPCRGLSEPAAAAWVAHACGGSPGRGTRLRNSDETSG